LQLIEGFPTRPIGLERFKEGIIKILKIALKETKNYGGYLSHNSSLGLGQPRLSGVGPMFRDDESVLQCIQMKVHPPKIMGCILLVWWHRLIKGLFSRPLAALHISKPIRKQIAPKSQKVWDEAGCFLIHKHGSYI